MARVYVSSPFADLRRERQAVMDWLVAAGHQPVHSYRPDSETVRDSCLDDVDTCDLYVLILGHRYGAQPPDGNPESLSITHMEHPERAARVLAFREEVGRAVRPARFQDNSGLVQGLSTGVQAELAKRS